MSRQQKRIVRTWWAQNGWLVIGWVGVGLIVAIATSLGLSSDSDNVIQGLR